MSPPPDMPHTAAEGWNAALAAIIALARSSAGALQARITERPTRYGYAIAALEALAETARELMLPTPPDGPDAAVSALPTPQAPAGGVAVAAALDNGA